MLRIATRLSACILAIGLIASAHAQAPRPAADIVKEIEALPATVETIQTRAQAEKKVELIGELNKAYPDDAHLAKFLPLRWQIMTLMGKGPAATTEAEAVASTTKDEALKATAKTEILYTKIQAKVRTNRNASAVVEAADEFIKAAPKDARGGMLLYSATMMEKDEAKKTAIEDRILKDFPDSPVVKSIAAMRKKKEAIGKPFELAFDDAIKGTHMSMKDLKGKVVVIDFWATWCGPCVAEMPNMKKLYAEYKDKGVEFIGVSLDQSKEKGGLDALKKFVADKEITWPQYYQGNFWQSEFSSGWGINSIPAVFVVDADGNLYSIEARGKLETLIPELLKKGKSSPTGGGF